MPKSWLRQNQGGPSTSLPNSILPNMVKKRYFDSLGFKYRWKSYLFLFFLNFQFGDWKSYLFLFFLNFQFGDFKAVFIAKKSGREDVLRTYRNIHIAISSDIILL